LDRLEADATGRRGSKPVATQNALSAFARQYKFEHPAEQKFQQTDNKHAGKM
jgi:hypothetical protein